jgi:hypothetical protein
MKKPSALFISAFLTTCLCACNLPVAATPGGTNPNAVATNVELTLAVFTQSAQSEPLSSPTVELLSSPTVELLSSPTKGQPVSTNTLAATPSVTLTFGPSPNQTLTLAPTNTPIPKPGSIAGAITGYPYGSQPSLAIVAFGKNPPYYYSYIIINPGAGSYSMSNDYLIPGPFQVVAYDSSGNSGGCPALVTVISEQTVTCNITNWGGGYPPKPSGVPNP